MEHNCAVSVPQPSRSSFSSRERSGRQTDALQRGNRNVVVAKSKRLPPRTDLTYIRPSYKGKEPDRGPLQLLDALLWMHPRRGAAWTSKDSALMNDTHARTFGRHELERTIMTRTPKWLPSLLPGNLRRTLEFVVILLTAHRVGAIGALLSYADMAGLLDICPSTAGRWVGWLEDARIIEVMKTWRPAAGSDKPGARKRGYGKHLYRLGPAIHEAVGLAVLEGAAGLAPGLRSMVNRAAKDARARSRRHVESECNRRWIEVNGPRPYWHPEYEGNNETPPAAPPVVEPVTLSLSTDPLPPPVLGGREIGRASRPASEIELKAAASPPLPPASPAPVASTRDELPCEPKARTRAASDGCNSRATAICMPVSAGAASLAAWRPSRPLAETGVPESKPPKPSPSKSKPKSKPPKPSPPPSKSSKPPKPSKSKSKPPPPSKSSKPPPPSKPRPLTPAERWETWDQMAVRRHREAEAHNGGPVETFERWVEIAEELAEVEALSRIRSRLKPPPNLKIVGKP